MKHNKMKLRLSIILVFVMLMSIMPSVPPAYADYEGSESSAVSEYTPIDNGSLIISKQVSGSGMPSADAEFEFTITKDGKAAVGKYIVGNSTMQSIPSDGKIRLKAGESALLTKLASGEYTVTETKPEQTGYESTAFSVNGKAAELGLTATVTVTAAMGSTGGWYTKNGEIAKDNDGYFVYTITKEQIDKNGNIIVDCNPLAEYMEYVMQTYQNWSTCGFKVKFVNETGTTIRYKDYTFDTVNWIPVGANYIPSDNPVMLNTNEGADEYSAGYGWGEAWQKLYPMFTGKSLATATLNTTGFDGNDVRLVISPLRCINPAIISYFESNPGYDTLTGNSATNSGGTITLLQMNAFPELIKKAFTFKDYQGSELSLEADESRTYADFICAFYNVSSLSELTVTQKYNVFGTGYKGSPGVKKAGQANIYTYYSNSSGEFKNWCIPYSKLNDGTLNNFEIWGISTSRIETGKKLIRGGQVFSEEDAAVYAYQQNYYMLESDPEITKMTYEYLYDRCMRITFDNDNRPVSTAVDDSDTPANDVSSVKSYIDKSDTAKANVLAAMNGGAAVADNEAITLDNMKGYIEVPNAWSVLRYYDFGFELVFKADSVPEASQTASVSYTNTYKADSVLPNPETGYGSLKVSKTVSGNAGDKEKEFTFTVNLGDSSINGVYGDIEFTDGEAIFTLKHGESKTARRLPENVMYSVSESDNSDYIVTVNGRSGTTASGQIIADKTAEATFNNHKTSGGGCGHKPSPVMLTLRAVTTLDGETPKGSEFTFNLKNAKGDLIQTQQNNDGEIIFNALSFSSEGTFVYTISEVTGGNSNINYDETVYKVIIKVTESNDYIANVTYEKDGEVYDGIPLFANTTITEPTPPNTPEEPENPMPPDTPNVPGASDEVPETDDSMNLTLWTLLIGISGIGMAAAQKKRKNYRSR